MYLHEIKKHYCREHSSNQRNALQLTQQSYGKRIESKDLDTRSKHYILYKSLHFTIKLIFTGIQITLNILLRRFWRTVWKS